MARELTQPQKIEQSLTKRFRKEIWSPFLTAIREYELIEAGDKIAVCISGGKDSMCLAKLMQMIQRHSDIPFEVCFLVMDPGYAEKKMQESWESRSKYLLPRFLILPIMWTNLPAISAPECGVGHSMPRQRREAATRSHWGII